MIRMPVFVGIHVLPKLTPSHLTDELDLKATAKINLHKLQSNYEDNPMPTRLRIATFNLMNLDDRPDRKPSLEERIPILRPQLVRLDADILCLQEVCGQHEHGRMRLTALNRLLECTPYEGYHRLFPQVV